MTLLQIAEIFGTDVSDDTTEARNCRARKWCPFRSAPCNKGRIDDPLGVCTFGDGRLAGSVCPSRFLENDRIFADAGRLAFGLGAKMLVAPEMRILRTTEKHPHRIGKVDYIIGKLGKDDSVVDFSALEVQAVYFSGRSIQPAFREYLKSGTLPKGSARRLDYRSSAQKRLMPQLNLKVPVFRRWGKKFFVAVDGLFFASLPQMRTVPTVENSEVTWLVYSIEREKAGYHMSAPEIHFTNWDDVVSALREGQAPTPGEILAELSNGRGSYRVMSVVQ